MCILSRRNFIAAGITAGAGFSAKNALAQPAPGNSPSIDDFFRDFTSDWVSHDPDDATASRYFTGARQDRLERQLTPLTKEWKLDRVQRAQRGIAELRKFNRSSLNETQRVSADLMDWELTEIVQAEPYLDYSFPLQQMSGANVGLVSALTIGHPLATEHDAENYIAALGEVRTRMEEAIAESKRLEAKNVIPPAFILRSTVKQIQGFSDPSPSQNPFITVFADKMAAIKGMPDARRDQLRAAAEKLVGDQIYPAWAKAVAVLQAQQAKATEDAGLWRLKGGDEAYSFFLHHYTTTKLTPAQVHEIGLQQVDRIEREMDVLLKRLGHKEGTVKARIDKLALEMQYPSPTSEASRAQIMRDIEGILADAQQRAIPLFDLRPKAAVVAKPYPTFREANAAASYTPPSPDGSRPGTFQYPRRVERMTKFGLKTTVYHETVPGHHFQIALEVEEKSLPRFRQIGAFGGISAFAEGWGLYAERLAAESGWYGEDIAGLLGQLNGALFRARRLVVDTGIHSMKWTRQQSIDYGIEASEIERYTVFPGQACSYMIGQMKIVELREKAKNSLRDKFSLREFHNVVLRTGMVPLDILAGQIDGYIKSGGVKA